MNNQARGIDLPGYIESTLLRDNVTDVDIDELCSAAIWFRFLGVCIYQEYVACARELLAQVSTRLVTVVNFPHGNLPLDEVCGQINAAIAGGADEIDYVMNLSAAHAGDWETVATEIKTVADLIHSHDRLLKVILETCLLSDEQKVMAAGIALRQQADFVKTSTGFSTGGATVDDVRLLRATVGSAIGVKASGGIRDRDTAIAMINAGANRLGTSSGLAIIGAAR